jgi:hypothetical protein
MGKISLHLHRAAVGKMAKLDQFLAFGRLHKDEFGAARGFMATDLLEAEHAFVKIDALFEIVQAVARVEEFASDRFHNATIGVYLQERNKTGKRSALQTQANLLRWLKGLSSK